MIFENNVINLNLLPNIKEGTFQQLDKNYLKVSYIGNVIFFLMLLGGLLSAYQFTDLSENAILLYSLFGLWFIWVLSSFIFTKLGYNIRGYILREKDLIHRKGVLFKTLTTIPFNRVQHCEVSQGPIQRLFDLHTLEIFTAGGSNSDLSIPGLKGNTAQLIKDFIIKKTVEDESVKVDESSKFKNL